MKPYNSNIKVSGIVQDSIVDGVGIRLSIFAQGCHHHCSGCHNVGTQSFDGGYYIEASDILKILSENPLLDGVTFSGGDPMFQASQFYNLAKDIRKHTDKTIWCYTGFTFDEIINGDDEDRIDLLKICDVLIDGKFEINKKNLSILYRGSNNQDVIDVKKSLELNSKVLYNLE